MDGGPVEGVYNLIPLNNIFPCDHPCLRFPEVQAAINSLRDLTANLPKTPPSSQGRHHHHDLLDWLALFFGFQADNVRNQREHLVLHLANLHMRRDSHGDNLGSLDPAILRDYRNKLLENYEEWCAYLGVASNVMSSDNRDLAYISLYLLIWGESANLRFLPECICFIFHNMAMELNQILDESTGELRRPAERDTLFLDRVVKPIYNAMSTEVEKERDGVGQFAKWRNYDDFNEYFWSKRCFHDLKWPLDPSSKFFGGAGKTGFVERWSFWNLFRSFSRLWLMLVLFLQGAVIVAWEEKKNPFEALSDMDVKVRVLTVFVTWSCVDLLESVLDILMQYKLVSRYTLSLGIRMLAKLLVSITWTASLGCLYVGIWVSRNKDEDDSIWSPEASRQVSRFLKAAVAFVMLQIWPFVQSFLPFISHFLNNKRWRILMLFRKRLFIGRGLREGMWDYTKYSAFWIFVLVSKFYFSYSLQILPMVNCTKQLWNLKGVDYKLWHQILDERNVAAIALLWLPVILIYLMDLQLWFSIWSFLFSPAIGLFSRLGEIQHIRQLKLRFGDFVRQVAYKFGPVAAEEHEHRLFGWTRLRFGWLKMKSHRRASSPRIKNLESNPEMVQKFSVLWNEIIASFREEDIISDTEFELLELPPNHWSLRVICWPSFLLCNELDIAIRAAAELRNATDKKLWYKICNNEYRRTAVIEAYDSVRYLLLLIIDPSTKEHTMVTDLFKKLDLALEDQKFTQEFDLSSLGSIRNWIIDFLYTLITPNAHPRRSTARALQNLYIVVVVDFIKGRKNNLQPNEGHFKEDVVKFPNDTIDEAFVRRLLTILISSNETMQYFPEIEKAKRGIEMQDFPRGEEAKRRITFFCNSVFMKIPRAPSVEKMKAFSVLTPYYEEDVLYSSKQVDIFKDNETTGSTSLLLPYLKTVYKDDWKNFKQRMRRQGMRHKRQLGTIKLNDLRLWASYRGQTLARTVRGMMYYRRALEILACLESLDSQTNQQLADEHGIVGMKFTYVVACQSYAVQKKRGDDERGADILYLMKNNEAMRVAYIDTVENCRGSGQHEYYSVLVKYDQTLNKEVEIYRIKLPGSCMLGEGKPENQNQAIIFTRGDAVQTIDMNQDNYLEEALKMPNLLEEFDKYHGIRKPTILGLREHIFTGSISSLAWFMSAQETGFVTSGQRVQANLLKVRMHYGHPDVFDRIWFMGRGGISKATRKINICEDIFAGFNCTLRGGNVTHHEYIQVGKGRDVSLDQITMFEAKIAGGSAGQLVSRDIYRLAHRVDFFRMLSLFHSTVGFYYNTVLVIWAIYAIQWSKVYVALSGLEATTNNGAIKSAFGAVFSIQVIQLVQYTGLPMIIEDALEHGLILGVKDFLIMQMQLASVFYTFSMGTRGHYFDRTVLHGGAKYLGTGREIIVQHQSFPEMYRLYSRSHFVKAIELALLIIVYDIYSPSNYGTVELLPAEIMAAIKALFFITLVIQCALLCQSRPTPKRRASKAATLFDVTKFGAVGDGLHDDSKAFKDAWRETCNEDKAPTPTLYVPLGKTFFLKSPLSFAGECYSKNVAIRIDGGLLAPEDPSAWTCTSDNCDPWIEIVDMSNLKIYGLGSINFQGSQWWDKDYKNKPTGFAITNSNDVELTGVTFNDSPHIHVLVSEGSERVHIHDVDILAPERSRNADGIHIEQAEHVTIEDSMIATGGSCVSIGDGSAHVDINRIRCGSGDGISIILGKHGKHETVEDVNARDSTFDRTRYGARITTYQGGSGYARGITFEGMTITGVSYPIVIDQTYCDGNKCSDNNKSSGVDISNVTFKGFTGTARSKQAVKLLCSKTHPCKNINMEDIDVGVTVRGVTTSSICSNVMDSIGTGIIYPGVSCISGPN